MPITGASSVSGCGIEFARQGAVGGQCSCPGGHSFPAERLRRVAWEWAAEGISKDLPPFVLQKLLGDFAVTYELNVYCKDPLNMMKLYTALHQNILDVFNENNVQIMTPAYEGDPHEPKVVPKDKWYLPLVGKSKSEGEKK